MIHKAYKQIEIAERYYKKIGKFTTRDQAKKNFGALKKPDPKLIAEILDDIHREAKELLRIVGEEKETE